MMEPEVYKEGEKMESNTINDLNTSELGKLHIVFKLTEEEASHMGSILLRRYHSRRHELDNFCDMCFIRNKPTWCRISAEMYKENLKNEVAVLRKLNKMFFSHIKYDVHEIK